VEFEPTASQPLPYWDMQGGPASRVPGSQGPAPSLAERLFQFNFRGGWLGPFWLVVVIGLVLLWEPMRIRVQAGYRPGSAPAYFYRGLRGAARPLTGSPPASQTLWEYHRLLSGRLADFEGGWLSGKWAQAARDELDALTRLYSASLFAMQAPAKREVIHGARAWTRLRWRLFAAGIMVQFRRKENR
jgi:hypothetical protein